MRRTLVLGLAVVALCLVGCKPKDAAPDSGATNGRDSSDISNDKSAPPITKEALPQDSATPSASGTASSTDSGAKEKTSAPVKKTGTTVVAYRNAKGDLVCPVMGTVIGSEDKATGYQDYKGVRYYFCCDDCPKLFKKDPEPWTKEK